MSMDVFTRRLQRISSSSDWTRKTLEFVPAMVLALLMAVFTFVPAASAAVPGLQRIASPVTSGSSPTLLAVATCPAGTKVIGTGGEVNGPLGRTILRRIIPNSTLTSVTATGAAINGGTTNTWTVPAFAICANAVAVPDVQLLQLNSAFDSKATKSVNINCPTGKKLLGSGGALFSEGTDRVVLFTAAPNGARTGAGVVGTELDSGRRQIGTFVHTRSARVLCRVTNK